MPTGVRNPTPRDLVPGFAKLVTEARERLGWSQRELARRAEVSAMCVCDLEAERRSPSLRIASKIAEALGLDVRLCAPSVPAPTKPVLTKTLSSKPKKRVVLR